MQEYTIWIEAEVWAGWNPVNANSDVIVTFADGKRWGATCVSYANLLSLVEKYQQTGECLSGQYFCASDLLLLDEISRPRIEQVVQHLIEAREFEQIFGQLRPEEFYDDE